MTRKIIEGRQPSAVRPRHVRWFSELTISDVPLVGGKNASLGENVAQGSMDPGSRLTVTLRVLRTEDRRSKGGP